MVISPLPLPDLLRWNMEKLEIQPWWSSNFSFFFITKYIYLWNENTPPYCHVIRQYRANNGKKKEEKYSRWNIFLHNFWALWAAEITRLSPFEGFCRMTTFQRWFIRFYFGILWSSLYMHLLCTHNLQFPLVSLSNDVGSVSRLDCVVEKWNPSILLPSFADGLEGTCRRRLNLLY